MNQNIKKNKTRTLGIILILSALIITALPFLFTRSGFEIFDFTETGQIGDTIGGITAPFVGLLGAYMVYRSFIVQVQTNTKQFESLEKQMGLLIKNDNYKVALDIIDRLDNALSDTSISSETMGRDFYGKNAFIEFHDILSRTKDPESFYFDIESEFNDCGALDLAIDIEHMLLSLCELIENCEMSKAGRLMIDLKFRIEYSSLNLSIKETSKLFRSVGNSHLYWLSVLQQISEGNERRIELILNERELNFD